MKLIGQKSYHHQENDLWQCMTEKEKEEYRAFLGKHNEVFRKGFNNDRSYKRKHNAHNDIQFWEQIESADEIVSLTPTTAKKGKRKIPNFVDMIEEAECQKEGKVHYRSEAFKQAVGSLTEKQRQALEASEIHDYSTDELARMWNCNERNVRKLRERAIHNVCKQYATILMKKRNLTVAERKFLEWYDAGKPELQPPEKATKKKYPDYLQQRYNEECGECVTVVPAPKVAIQTEVAV